MNEYNLNKESVAFLKGIEDAYQHPINIVEKDMDLYNHGFSSIIDGVPTIELNSKEKFKAETIVHEAFHLRLTYDGMPSIGFELNGKITEDNRFYLEWFAHLFWDKIIHYYFYDNMLNQLKVNPYKSLEGEIRSSIHDGKIQNLSEATMEIALAGYLLQVWIEIRDSHLQDDFRKLISAKYNCSGCEMGDTLIAFFKEQPCHNSNDCVQLFIKCFDYIHAKQSIRIYNATQTKTQYKHYCQNIVIFSIGN